MPLSPFRDALHATGLNLVGVCDVAAWDAVAPPARQSAALAPSARSIVVVANGGHAFWDGFCADLRRNPEHLRAEAHPLDAYARRCLTAAPPPPGALRWFHAAADESVHLDFRLLAHLAGLGHPSRLGLLLHPSWGPWLGLRAACFVAEALPPTPLSGAAPCDGCPAPCVDACPGGAFVEGRWSVDRCTDFHITSTRCATDCASRTACPVGAAHRYAPEQMNYHYDRLSGRIRLARSLDIAEDPLVGDGPHWGNWRTRVDVTGA